MADRQIHAEEKCRFYHYSYRLLTEAGVQNNSQLSISFEPSYETITLHQLRIVRAGRVIDKLFDQEIKVLQRESGAERQVYDGNLTALVVLEDIRVGDIVEYSYSIAGANPVFDGHFFHIEHTRWSAPIHQSRMRVFWDAGRPVKFRNQDSPVLPTAFTKNGLVVMQLEEENLDAVLTDGDLPVGHYSHPWLEFSDFPDWQSVSRWAGSQFPQTQTLPAVVHQEIDRLRQLKSNEQRILGALRWVQDNIRYVGMFQGIHSHRPFPLPTVVNRRFGDCKDKSNLLATILRELGFKCRIGLVSARHRAAIAEWIPSPDAFDHVVVGVDTSTGIRWLDATESYQRGSLSSLFFPDFGWVLPMDSETTELVRVTPSGLDQTSVEMVEKFDFDDYKGSARLSVITRYTGQQADSQRSIFASRSRDEIERSYLNHFAQDFPKIRAVKTLTWEDDEVENLFVTHETYEIKDAWKPAETRTDQLQFKVSASLVGRELFLPSTRIRTTPFFVPHPRLCTQTFEVTFPSQLGLNNDSDYITNPAFSFSVKETSSSKHTTVTYRYQSRKDHVGTSEIERYLTDVQNAQNQTGYTFTIPAHYASLSASELPVGTASNDPTTASFSPPGTLIVLCVLSFLASLVFCFVVYFWDPRPKPFARSGSHLGPGLGGWLWLLGIGIVLRAPAGIWNCLDSLNQLDKETWSNLTREGSPAYHILWEPFLITDTVIQSAIVPFNILLMILFFQRRTSFPALQSIFFIFIVIYTVGVSLVSHQIPSIALEDLKSSIQTFIKSLPSLLIWVPYLCTSKRVRHTFIEQRSARPQTATPPPLPFHPGSPAPTNPVTPPQAWQPQFERPEINRRPEENEI